jgi:hypothetical protein
MQLPPLVQRHQFRIVPGSAEQNEAWLAGFLSFHGYGSFSLQDRSALRHFQERHGLAATGNLNAVTCCLLNARRCVHPENTPTSEEEERRRDASGFQAIRLSSAVAGRPEPQLYFDSTVDPGSHQYEILRGRGSGRNLAYAFAGGPPAALGAAGLEAVRRAFASWDAAHVVSLREAANASESEIRVLWTPGPSADPASIDPFYGPGGYVAVGYYPYPQYGELAGDLHFDSSEAWTTGPSTTLDVETVAVHEIGHCLGIGHSRLQASAMWPAYKALQHEPTQEDFEELRRIYQGIPA